MHWKSHKEQIKKYQIKTKINICKIWGLQGGDYEECRLLGCGAVKTDVSEERVTLIFMVEEIYASEEKC
jgi:hypothetical protein